MTLTMMTKGDGTLIFKGDEYLFEKLPHDFDAASVDITDVRLDAQAVAKAFNDAECQGIEAIKRYFAIKAAFERQYELSLLPDAYERPTVANTPAISTASLRGMTL